MQAVTVFLADTLLSLFLYVFLLRLMLQWARANFRNPIAQTILQASNWLVLPLRRVLPPAGRLDSASLVAAFLIAVLHTGALWLLMRGTTPELAVWVMVALKELLRSMLWLYFWSIFIYALSSLIAAGVRSPLLDLLESLCEPVLERIRRAVPGFDGIDLSPMWAAIIIQVLLILLR